MLIDTHCHIHSEDYQLDSNEVFKAAFDAGVGKIICVGTDESDTALAIEFAANRKNCWATVGIHPHEAKHFDVKTSRLPELALDPKVVAVGETGIDYWYEHSPRQIQETLFKWQIDLALESDLPLIFHVRGSKSNPGDAFTDFFRILDEYDAKGKQIRGVVHSFSAGQPELTGVISRGLYVGLNGIMTFTGDERQLEAAKSVPQERLLLETDAPFLTPSPKRGTINQPKHLVLTAEFLAKLRGESISTLTDTTSANATRLFNL